MVGEKAQANPGFARTGMPNDVVQRLLQNSIDVNSRAAIDREGSARFFVVDCDTGLPLHHREIPINCALEIRLVEHDGMERLRKTAHIFEGVLRDVTNFAQFFANHGALGHLLLGAAEQGADSRQGLAEFVMKLPGNMTQGGFLSGDQLPREFAALMGERCQPPEQSPIRANQI